MYLLSSLIPPPLCVCVSVHKQALYIYTWVDLVWEEALFKYLFQTDSYATNAISDIICIP